MSNTVRKELRRKKNQTKNNWKGQINTLFCLAVSADKCTLNINDHDVKIQGFDRDNGTWPQCGKHGVSKAEIEYIFKNIPAVYPDIRHSLKE